MAHLSNCTNCLFAKEDCARRDTLRAGLKGLHVTSVKFICRERKPMFAAGQRVSVWWPVDSGCTDDWGRTDFTQEQWPATVVAERGNRFQIVVDDVESDHETPARDYIKSETLYCKVPAWRLSPIDEPRRIVCEVFQQVASDGKVAGCWTESGDLDSRYDYRPANCLARILASRIEAPSGGETGTGSTEGESLTGTAGDAQTPPPKPPQSAKAGPTSPSVGPQTYEGQDA